MSHPDKRLPPEAQKAVEEFCRFGRSYEWLYEQWFRSATGAPSVVFSADRIAGRYRWPEETPEDRGVKAALRDLLEQVDSLDDFTLTRDVDSYKAEANWNDALRCARAALAPVSALSHVEPTNCPHCTRPATQMIADACGEDPCPLRVVLAHTNNVEAQQGAYASSARPPESEMGNARVVPASAPSSSIVQVLPLKPQPETVTKSTHGGRPMTLQECAEAEEPAAVSSTVTPDPLTLELADELFGCFMHRAAPDADHTYECAVCEEPVSMPGWSATKHAEGCAVAKARDYLAQHAPHRTPGYVRPTDGRSAG